VGYPTALPAIQIKKNTINIPESVITRIRPTMLASISTIVDAIVAKIATINKK